ARPPDPLPQLADTGELGGVPGGSAPSLGRLGQPPLGLGIGPSSESQRRNSQGRSSDRIASCAEGDSQGRRPGTGTDNRKSHVPVRFGFDFRSVEVRPVMIQLRIPIPALSQARISTRLLLVFLGISLIPCGVLTVLTLYISAGSLEHSVRQHLM